MSIVTTSQFLTEMENIRTNPLAVQRLVINALDSALNGEERLLDPTNPFVFIMEGTVAIGTSCMQQSASLNRVQYAKAANTFQELFYHMSDEDYLDVFSSPSRTNFIFICGLDDIIAKGKTVPGSNNTKRIIIPRHSVIEVAGLPFTMQYPIVIDVTNTGIIKCYMDTGVQSPIQKISDNNLKWVIRRINGVTCLTIELPVLQVELVSTTVDVNIATVIKRDYNFPDMFYYCRVHMLTANGWQEIKTTHCPEVYNPNTPTALLTVVNNTMTLEIPQIYISNGLIRDTLRVDIYTTKGPQDLSLSSYMSDSYKYQWQDLDNIDSEFYAPLTNFSSIAIVSTSVVVGGHNGLTFEQLRDKVVNRSQVTAGLPLTNKQIPEFFKNLGYGLVTDIDNLTNRLFLATKEAPIPKNNVTITGVDLSVHGLRTNIDILTKYKSVKDNNFRVTITPDMLYTTSNGILTPVGDNEIERMLNPRITPPDALANIINSGHYLYSPFFYVLDVSSKTFETRVFNLNSPKIDSKETISTNHTLNIQMTLLSSSIDRIDGGYRLLVEYDSKSDIKNINIDNIKPQISFSLGGDARGYINGTFYGDIENGKPIDGNYKWYFDIMTDFDINKNNQLIIKPNNFPVNLINDFDLITMVVNFFPIGATNSDLDHLTNPTMLSKFNPSYKYVAVTHDRFTINFGKQLNRIWTRSRVVPDLIEYETYPNDVYLVADKDIPKTIAGGVPSIKINQDTGKPYIEIAIKKGEFILDKDGNKIIKHPKGTIKKDEYGEPKVKNGERGIVHEVELILFDGAYYFANDELSIGYMEETAKTITEWSSTDMNEIKKYLLPRTEVLYYPKVSSGNIKVTTAGNIEAEISAKQTLTFTFYVSEEVSKNTEIQEIINNTTKRVVSDYFKQSVLAKDELLNNVRKALVENIKGVSVKGFLDDVFEIATMADDSVRPSIGKSIQALSNLSLRVTDTLNFEYRII